MQNVCTGVNLLLAVFSEFILVWIETLYFFRHYLMGLFKNTAVEFLPIVSKHIDV